MPKMPAKMTIYKLGRELGISPSTVSKALNHSPEISAELRSRVQDLARANQFRPRLVSSRVPNICVLVQQLPGHPLDFSPFLARVMEGVAQYAREEGLEMSIFAADVNELNDADLVRELRRRSASGVVIVRANSHSQFFPQLESQHFAYTSLLTNDGQHTRHHIAVNECESATILVAHLAQLGHRNIAVLNHDPHSSSGQQRTAGVSAAMRQAGITETPLVVTPEGQQSGLDFGRMGVLRLLKDRPNVTALLAFDYMVGIGALRGAADAGIRIPSDLSLGCFDEYPESRYMTPALTTVGVPIEYLGYQAARDVHRQIRNLEPLDFNQDMRLRPVLNARESTAPVRK